MNYCKLISLIFGILLTVLDGFSQKVTVIYLHKDYPKPFSNGGGAIHFPTQYSKYTLQSSPMASKWILDSVFYEASPLFNEGYNFYIRGKWQFRDKKSKQTFTHNLIYERNEFEQSSLIAEDRNCNEWRIDPNKRKVILGLECIYAKRECFGRPEWIYFSTEIPIVDGPEYFDRIPGFVLEYKYLHGIYTAQSIDVVEGEVSPPKQIRVVSTMGPSKHTRLVVNKDIGPEKWIQLNPLYYID